MRNQQEFNLKHSPKIRNQKVYFIAFSKCVQCTENFTAKNKWSSLLNESFLTVKKIFVTFVFQFFFVKIY